jgi:hypothetical protein
MEVHITYPASLLRRLAGQLAPARAAPTPDQRPEDWIARLQARTCDSSHGIGKLQPD